MTNWLDRISPCPRAPLPGSTFRSFTGHKRHGPNWIEPLRVIYDYELVLVSEGTFIIEIEGRRHTCTKGSFIIVPPGHWHVSWEAAGRFGHRHWTHFDWTHQGPHGETPIMTFSPDKPRPDFYRWAPDFVPRQILQGAIPRFQRAMEISERLNALQKSEQDHARLLSRAVLLELLLELLDAGAAVERGPSTTVRIEEKVRTLLDLNAERHASIKVEDLLEQTGYSYAHVCRLFKKRYGLAPLKYLHLLCVSRAKLMLRDTPLPITEIARRLSFSDPEHFSQVFRRNVGHSPSAYRAMIQNEPAS